MPLLGVATQCETITVQSDSGATSAGPNLWGATTAVQALWTTAGRTHSLRGGTTTFLSAAGATGIAQIRWGAASLVTDLGGAAGEVHIRAGATILLHGAGLAHPSGAPPEWQRSGKARTSTIEADNFVIR